MAEDALWYEAAQVVGITNALNVVADVAPELASVLPPVADTDAPDEVAVTFREIRAFYARPDVPLPFRVAGRDPGYLADLWGATNRAFADQFLPRRLKEALAFAVSVTTRSGFGTAFHGGELRRLGVGDRGLVEVLGVTQMFSSYTKIADTLQLESDMAHIGPVDVSPAPGGPV